MAVKPGDPILKHLTASWYNRVDRASLPQRNIGGRGSVDGFDHFSITVVNHSTSSKLQYETVVLGDYVFDYEKPFDITHQDIVQYTKSSVSDKNGWGVLQEPLAGDIGASAKVLLKGLTWVRCLTSNLEGTSTLKFLRKQSVDHLEYTDSGRAEILHSVVVGDETFFLINLGSIGGTGSSVGRLFKTPTGGIPAASGSTWGSAVCDEYDDAGVDLLNTETIYNQRTAIVPGDVFVLVLPVGTRLFVWESNCPTTITEPISS